MAPAMWWGWDPNTLYISSSSMKEDWELLQTWTKKRRWITPTAGLALVTGAAAIAASFSLGRDALTDVLVLLSVVVFVGALAVLAGNWRKPATIHRMRHNGKSEGAVEIADAFADLEQAHSLGVLSDDDYEQARQHIYTELIEPYKGSEWKAQKWLDMRAPMIVDYTSSRVRSAFDAAAEELERGRK